MLCSMIFIRAKLNAGLILMIEVGFNNHNIKSCGMLWDFSFTPTIRKMAANIIKTHSLWCQECGLLSFPVASWLWSIAPLGCWDAVSVFDLSANVSPAAEQPPLICSSSCSHKIIALKINIKMNRTIKDKQHGNTASEKLCLWSQLHLSLTRHFTTMSFRKNNVLSVGSRRGEHL